jgi:hypothetical protein
MNIADNPEASADEVPGLDAAKRRFAEHRDAIKRLAQNVGSRLEVEANIASQLGDKKTELSR